MAKDGKMERDQTGQERMGAGKGREAALEESA